ncbi:tail completion protein gp17 [Bacillus sp. 0102A]|uniref:tail completion protein gp17 n=1 Tax=Bacillus sp. 0102A TaxID=3120563 RepID=UPI002FD92B30
MTMDPVNELVKTLTSSSKLNELVTGGIHNLIANDVNAFPRVVFYEFKDADAGYADNKAYCFEVRFQVSIFTQSNTRRSEKPIANEIDKLMRSIGYGRYDSHPLYEEDTKVYHKAMRYVKGYFKEEE